MKNKTKDKKNECWVERKKGRKKERKKKERN